MHSKDVVLIMAEHVDVIKKEERLVATEQLAQHAIAETLRQVRWPSSHPRESHEWNC
jgi:hypothetical protein